MGRNRILGATLPTLLVSQEVEEGEADGEGSSTARRGYFSGMRGAGRSGEDGQTGTDGNADETGP